MRLHKQVRLGGAVLCLIGVFAQNPSYSMFGILFIMVSLMLQGDYIEKRLDDSDEGQP